MFQIRCCKDCSERVPHCHSFCAKYLAEKAEIEEAREQKQKERQIMDYYFQKKYKHHTVRYVNSTARKPK